MLKVFCPLSSFCCLFFFLSSIGIKTVLLPPMRFFVGLILIVVSFSSCRSVKHIVAGSVDSMSVPQSKVLEYRVRNGDSLAYVIPGPQYKASSLRQFFAGTHYRDAWTTPIWVPVLHLSEVHGGLIPFKKGGNKQSLVVNVKDKDGEVFTIRSIQKNPVKALPMHMRNPFVVKAAKDQVCSMHPLGAFLIPSLADALGVIHAEPKLFYVSNDASFKEFRNEFAGRLVMVEQKFEGNVRLKGYPQPFKAIKTEDAIIELRKDTALTIDQETLLKARFLDMIVGDWDRSEDQWKWIISENNGKRTLLPVPRDRDQAFVKMDGVFPWFYSRKFVTRKYQGFRERITDLIGLNWNARTFDRNFLNDLSRKDWLRIALEVQRTLNDSVIDHSLNQWPVEYRRIDGEEIVRKLKNRRDQLTDVALEYYLLVAEDVNVSGSDSDDLFKISRYKGDSVNVKMFRGKDTINPVYQRTVYTKETNEVVLYGNGGNDLFRLDGHSDDGVLVRIIGGDGRDSVVDYSSVSGYGKFTKVYDLRNETGILSTSEETKNLLSYDVRINENSSSVFEYDRYSPKLLVTYNIDQGVSIGVGGFYVHENFRKKPYAFRHEFEYGQSLSNRSYFIITNSDFVNLLGKWGLQLNNFLYPQFITSFYGFGNETQQSDYDIAFYKVRMNRTYINPMLYRKLNDRVTLSLGSEYSRHTAFADPGKYVNVFIPGRKLHQEFVSAKFEYSFRNTDRKGYRTGLAWKNYATWKFGITQNLSNFSRVGTEGILYQPIRMFMNPVIAVRAGVVTNFDAFPFYESNFLGGFNFERENETIRGYRRNRFAGRTACYTNTELRLRLITFSLYGEAGVFGFYDRGRVWMENERSDVWHSGTGGGLWIRPFKKWMVTLTSAHSKEESLFNVDMGFFF